MPQQAIRAIGGICLGALLMLTACGKGSDPGAGPQEAGGRKNSVTVAASGGASYVLYMDPTLQGLRFSPHTHVYDPIVRYNPGTQQWEPMLALSWERIDRNRMRFHLRREVEFHNGSPLTAHDVAFTLGRIKDPELASPVNGFYHAVSRAEVIDDHTFDVIGKAYGILPAMNVFMPVDQETFEAVGAEAYNLNPIGTGPYHFVEWELDDFITLRVNTDYWGETPKIEHVTFRFVSDRATKMLMLQSGEADIIDEVSPDMIDDLEKHPQIDVRSVPSHRTNFITINTFREPFDDVRVRQAMAHAIHWQEIIDKLYGGLGYRQAALSPKIIEHYDPDLEPYDYDPEKARQLLAEAGFPNGFTVDDPFKTPVGWMPIDNIASEVIVANLEAVGIRMGLWMAEEASYNDKWLNKDVTLGFFSCGNQMFAADFCYNAHFHPNFRGFYFNHPQLTNMLDDFSDTVDPDQQRAAMKEIQRFVHENVGYIPGFVGDFIYGVNANLEWEPSSDERVYLHNAEWRSR